MIKHGVRIPENPTVHVPAPKQDEVKENHWKKPAPSGKKILRVSHDALPLTARKIRHDMDDLNAAITKLKATYQRVGSLTMWSTGQQFSGNMQAALDGFVTATEQNRDAHDVTAQNLVDTADHYAQAEHNATQHAKSVHHAQLVETQHNLQHQKTELTSQRQQDGAELKHVQQELKNVNAKLNPGTSGHGTSGHSGKTK